MTIASAVAKSGPYAGNGSQTVFAYTFKVFAASELQVVLRSAGGIETVQTLTTHYAVSGVGNDGGGNVTMVTAPPSGTTLTIVRNVPFVQLTDLRNQGGFYPEVHERVFDRLTQQTQQLNDSIGRALQVAVSTPAGVETTLPSPAPEKLIGWNAAGTGLQNFDASVLATLVAYGTGRVDLFDGDGVTTQFTLTSNPGNQSVLDVSIGGVTQRAGVDFVWTGGTTLTFVTPPPAGIDNILARYFQGLPGIITEAQDVTFTQAGAGAIVRTAQAKMRDIINVIDFGATGNGLSDDTIAIQAAINRAASNGGGNVYFPPGVFRITSQLSVTTSGVRLIGSGSSPYYSGAATEIAWHGAANTGATMLYFQFADDVGFEGMELNCRNLCGIGLTAQGVKLSSFSRFSIRDFTNAGFNGICGDVFGQWSSSNKVENFLITSANNGVVGLFLNGSTVENNDWWNNVFKAGFVQVARTATPSYAAALDFCDSNTFVEVDFGVYGAGNGAGLLLRSQNRNAYPENNFFYSCSIQTSVQVIEGGGKFIGDHFFFAHTLKDGETIPRHPKLRGFTDAGSFFGEVFTIQQNAGRLRFAPNSANRSYDILHNADDTNDFGLQVIRRVAGADTVIGQWAQNGAFYVFIQAIGLKEVQVGAADSAGTGFRTLKVSN